MATYKLQKYLLMTLDPVHIGTGGYRLGRVDNSIVRETGTHIPKIPGTSLHGAARSYAAQLYETPEAAGQSQDEVVAPDNNPVCYTFGYVKKVSEDETKAYSGVVNLFDAHILLFPVYSMAGPVWVTTLSRLKEAIFKVEENDSEEVKEEPEFGKALLSSKISNPLNLGWLMVEIIGQANVDATEKWQKEEERWNAVKNKIVIVNEALFSHIVNANLEVRTSVSINPETGAAEEGALFTYEAIPRATFLTMDVVLDDYREDFPSEKTLQEKKSQIESQLQEFQGASDFKEHLQKKKGILQSALEHISKLRNDRVKEWKTALDVVDAGLGMIEYLGVGGMGTRGFGRMAIVGKQVCILSDEHCNQDNEVASQ